jgi:hypothetical protein
VAFSLTFATAGADEAGAGLAVAANGFSTGGGDGRVGWEDEAAGAGATEVGAAAGVSSLRNLSLYFILASSVAEAARLANAAGSFSTTAEDCACGAGLETGAAGLSSVALAKEDGFSATGDSGAGLEDGATGAGAAVIGAAAGGSSRNLSLMAGLAVAGADGAGAAGEGTGGLSGLRGGDSSPMRPPT